MPAQSRVYTVLIKTKTVGVGLVPTQICRKVDLRQTASGLHSQTDGMTLTTGICENNDPNPTDTDEHKAR